jgi:hypothetical protein
MKTKTINIAVETVWLTIGNNTGHRMLWDRKEKPNLGSLNDVTTFIKLNAVPAATAAHSVPDALLAASGAALIEIQNLLQETYNKAYPVCCGRPGQECCGSPEPEWSEYDQGIMSRFQPIEEALRKAMLNAAPSARQEKE